MLSWACQLYSGNFPVKNKIHMHNHLNLTHCIFRFWKLIRTLAFTQAQSLIPFCFSEGRLWTVDYQG